jgi:hypothetical protein
VIEPRSGWLIACRMPAIGKDQMVIPAPTGRRRAAGWSGSVAHLALCLVPGLGWTIGMVTR